MGRNSPVSGRKLRKKDENFFYVEKCKFWKKSPKKRNLEIFAGKYWKNQKIGRANGKNGHDKKSPCLGCGKKDRISADDGSCERTDLINRMVL